MGSSTLFGDTVHGDTEQTTRSLVLTKAVRGLLYLEKKYINKSASQCSLHVQEFWLSVYVVSVCGSWLCCFMITIVFVVGPLSVGKHSSTLPVLVFLDVCLSGWCPARAAS